MQVAAYVILIMLQGFILISLWTILYQAVKQQGRLLRLDALDHRLTEAGLGAGPGTSTGQGGLEVGTPVTSPSLPDPDGRLISLDDFRSKRVLLVHWNPDCAFCELLASDLAQFQADLRTSKVQLVLASSEDAKSNRELALEHGLTCPILLMPDDGPLARETFKDQGTPVAYLLDEQGKVAQPVAVGGDEFLALARGVVGKPAKRIRLPGERPLSQSRIERHGLRGVPSPRRSACPTFAARRLPLRITEAGVYSWSSRTRPAGTARNSRPTSSGSTGSAAAGAWSCSW